MTSSTDTTGHPDVAEISDLAEGLLPPSRSAEVRRHLEDCDACAEVHAALAEIQGLLGGVPEVPPMPTDIADRIDAALAAEATAQTEQADSVSPGRHVSRETPTPPDRPARLSRATTGPGRKERSRSRRRTAALGAVLTAAVLGAGSLLMQSVGNNASDKAAQSTAASAAGTFSGASVKSQVSDLLTAREGVQRGSQHPQQDAETDLAPSGPTQSANTLIQTEVPVPDCVRRALHPGETVLGAKSGTYADKSAYLVVVPDKADSKRVTAYVVDASCTSKRTAAVGSVLLKQSLVRS
ncbi:anti-sigma factor family protein [Streptomyces sp. NRRL F-2799]|uniref:anti-sigma factor family protein n=1 Tax=Streptomyces sp. NRRL F-2799 TaxID=1463844 RepID=UPI0004C9F3FB|nr:zf-HC2 domain-containing protein [Streptomyces sp. NRRL F-2799]